jgi:N utilization substance protein B
MKHERKPRRHPARLAAVQAMYQRSMNFRTSEELVDDFCSVCIAGGGKLYAGFDLGFFKDLLRHFDDELGEYQLKLEMLESKDDCHFNLQKTSLVARAIIKVAAIEMSMDKLDRPMIINEYLNIAKEFIDPKEVKFVNVILDSLLKSGSAKLTNSELLDAENHANESSECHKSCSAQNHDVPENLNWNHTDVGDQQPRAVPNEITELEHSKNNAK